MAAKTTQTRNLTHGSLTIKGNTQPAQQLIVPIMEGDLEFTCRDVAKVISNRGVLSHFSAGVQTPCAIRFTIGFVDYKGKSFTAAPPTPIDAMRKQGNASTWVSTQSCGPYVTDLDFALANPCSGAGTGIDQTEVLTFADFHLDEWAFGEKEDMDTIKCSGNALVVQPSSARSGT